MKTQLLAFAIVLFLFVFGCSGNSEKQVSINKTNISTNTLVTSNISATINGSDNMQDRKVKNGDIISVDYVGTLVNGTVFDTNIEAIAIKAGLLRPKYEPFRFKVGTGQVIPGFDNAVIGMKVNERKEVHMPPEDAYGNFNPNYIILVSLGKINGGKNLTVGGKVYANNGAIGTIKKIENGNATVDFNSELAGQALNFNITIRSIN